MYCLFLAVLIFFPSPPLISLLPSQVLLRKHTLHDEKHQMKFKINGEKESRSVQNSVRNNYARVLFYLWVMERKFLEHNKW